MVGNVFTTDKIFHHGDVLHKWSHGCNVFPITVEIDPIGACNSHCPCCVGGERKGRLEDNMVFSLLYKLSCGGTRGIIFTGGGEPTLHPSLPKFIKTAFDLGLDVGLITNGLRITQEIISVVQYCKWIRVSLDASTPQDYMRSHGGTQTEFNTVCQNIARITAIDSTVGVGVLADNNIDIVKAARLADRLGANYIQFRPYYEGWFGNKTKLNVKQYREQFNAAKEIEHECFSVLESTAKFDKMERDDTSRQYDFCWGQQFCGVVTAMGDVTLCCLTRGKDEFTLGNLYENTFTQIWNSEKRKIVLANLDVKTMCPPLCRCDSINKLLQDFRDSKSEHMNFL